ncbi:MAG TPA: pitrilysin family protein [Methylomirabilota bacterium]|nr:pitrilysin family protein [Methylomirabilota bacterium]
MRSALLLVATLAALAAPAAAQPSVARHVLPNGMVVLVRDDPGVGVVAASLMVRTGSAFETAETAGITNFLHRVMLRGTRRHSALSLAEAVEDLGGTLEASGDVEYAEVRGTAIARHWEALLTLLAEVALEATLPESEIDKERALLLAQLYTRGDMPFSRAFDTTLNDLYGSHPYAWPAVGRLETVTRLDRAALVARYAEVYRADRMVLAVSGNVPRAGVLARAGTLFKRVPGASGRPAAPAGEASARGERRVLERAARQAQVVVGYLAPPLTHPDYAVTRVLGAVLGGGMSSRMFVELRDRRGLAYATGVITTYRTGPAFIVPYLGTAPANTEAALAGVLAEVDRMRREPVDDRELARAKAWLLGNLVMDRRTNARHAWYLAFFELVGGGFDWPERYARAVEGVTAADVARVANQYLTRPTVVVLRPADVTR